MCIGVGQGGALLRRRDPQAAERALTTGQAAADCPEGLRPAEAANAHGHELTPRGEAPGVRFGFPRCDGVLILESREALEQPAQRTHAPLHGCASCLAVEWDQDATPPGPSADQRPPRMWTSVMRTLFSIQVCLVSLAGANGLRRPSREAGTGKTHVVIADRKSTRLNSSHHSISYAVFCLKKKR